MKESPQRRNSKTWTNSQLCSSSRSMHCQKGNSRSQEPHLSSSHHDLGVVPGGISKDPETLVVFPGLVVEWTIFHPRRSKSWFNYYAFKQMYFDSCSMPIIKSDRNSINICLYGLCQVETIFLTSYNNNAV